MSGHAKSQLSFIKDRLTLLYMLVFVSILTSAKTGSTLTLSTMNRQKYDKKYNSQGHQTELYKSSAEAMMAAVDTDIGGVLHHTGAVVHSLQGMIGNSGKERKFQRQRDLMIVKLQEARMKIYQGKKKMGMFFRGEIRVGVAEVDDFERRVNVAQTWDDLMVLKDQIEIALGWRT
jgi:hypothetical protein